MFIAELTPFVEHVDVEKQYISKRRILKRYNEYTKRQKNNN